MDAGTGITLFETGDLKLNIENNQEEDEEAIEDQKRREELLKAQLANAFDDWSEDEANEEDRVHTSGSSMGEASPKRSSHLTNGTGMIFHNLSAISEHSPSKSGYDSLDVSRDSGTGNQVIKNGHRFSPSRSVPYKFVQAKSLQSGHSDYLSDTGGRGDADYHYQPLFKNNSSGENGEKFQPLFSNTSNEKSEHSIDNSAEAYRQAEANSVDQLRVLYDVRLREIHRLTSQLEEERCATATLKKDNYRKMALLEAEKERAILSRDEASKLLVASKEEIGKLQDEMLSLKQTVDALEKNKKSNEEMAELSKLQNQELEQRMALMERCDSNKQFIKQTDIMIKDLKEKHQVEIQMLQRQLETTDKKLSKKEEEYQVMEQKVSELQKTQDQLIVDKSEIINQLAHNLEQSQAQCRQLMAASVAVDNIRLQTQLEETTREKDQLSHTVRNLQSECSMIKADLAQFESVSRLTLPNSSSSEETDSIIQMGIRNGSKHSRQRSSNINVTDTSTKLKDELHRALLNQKVKRAEICRLQELVNEKEKQIREMEKQERIYLANAESMNEKFKQMMVDLKTIQQNQEKNNNSDDKSEEISTLKAEMAEMAKDKTVLEREKLEIQQKFDDLTKCFEADKQREISDHNKEYLRFHDETVAKVRKKVEEEAEIRIKEYRVRLDQSLKEVAEIKEMYVEVCSAKEQVTSALDEANSQLQQLSEERNRLAAELQSNRNVRDQLARRLNETADDRLKAELNKCTEIRDQLARRVNTLKRENDDLAAEIKTLKSEQLNSPGQIECQLRAELSAMSERHAQELSSARAELQGSRDRVVQLEKCARLQFETEIKSLRQDRDMLKTKCDEKEVQIKKLIESRKRAPAMVSVAVETEMRGDVLSRCKEEYNKMMEAMQQAHQETLTVAQRKSQEELERLQEQHQQIIEAIREQLEQQQVRHREELAAVEERTKQLTVKYFAEEVKRLEAKYIEEASRQPDPELLNTLHNSLVDKNREIESLKQMLKSLSEECRHQMTALRNQMDEDKENTAKLMVQWAHEIKSMQGELKLKEAIIDDQRSKLEKAHTIAKKYRNKLIKTNQEITAQYMSKCAEYKASMQDIIDENEKQVFDKIKRLEQVYEDREKELKKKISRKQHVS